MSVKLVFAYLLLFGLTPLSALTDLTLKPGGWIDIKPTKEGSHISSISARDSTILVVFGNSEVSEVILLNESLTEEARWSVPGPRQAATLSREGVILSALSRNKDDGFSHNICHYSQVGSKLGGCATVDGVVHHLEPTADGVCSIGSSEVTRVVWSTLEQHRMGFPPFASAVPPLSASVGNKLFRIDALSGQALLADTDKESSKQILMLSPRLTENLSARHDQEILIAKALAWCDAEVWLVPGRLNILRGLPIVRFNLNGELIQELLLEVPAFKDLKRATSETNQYANPTGHLVTDFLAASKNRAFAVDRSYNRIVWYDLTQLK